MNKRAVCLFVTIFFYISVSAQNNKTLQDTFLEAEYFFMQEDYSDALAFYLQLYDKLPENYNLAYRIGVCYLNIPGKKNLSVSYLETATKSMSAKHKEGTINEANAPYDALFDLGTAYRINYMFDKAKDSFSRYSETLLPDDKVNLDFIKHEMKVCDNAQILIKNPVSFTEENMGELFNDDKANFNPLISSDGKSFAFTVSLEIL